MKKNLTTSLLIILIVVIGCNKSISTTATTSNNSINSSNLTSFSYPKREHTTITMKGDKFKAFTKEWRGEDYYYYGESDDKIICSVLYYKLNKDEQKIMVDAMGMTSPAIPLIYFTDNSQLKKYEKNVSGWGQATDDFIARQYDILDFEGKKIKQKHMNAYAMFDKDIFVNIHLSKTNFTSQDSTTMRAMLTSLTKKK